MLFYVMNIGSPTPTKAVESNLPESEVCAISTLDLSVIVVLGMKYGEQHKGI